MKRIACIAALLSVLLSALLWAGCAPPAPREEETFVRIVIAGRSEGLCVPCGTCRQVLREFAPDIEIICLNGAGEERTFTLEELLPHSFGPEYLL